MTLSQALSILKPQGNDLDAIKAAYRAAAKMYHPDINPAGAELMKLINQAYEILLRDAGTWNRYDQRDADKEAPLTETMAAIWEQIKHLVGLKIEVCGTWLWVSGPTKQYRQQLKEAGLRWSPNKTAWYWRPAGYKKQSRKKYTMDEIRSMWGSKDLDNEPLGALA